MKYCFEKLQEKVLRDMNRLTVTDSRGPEIETTGNVRKAPDCRFQTFRIFQESSLWSTFKLWTIYGFK